MEGFVPGVLFGVFLMVFLALCAIASAGDSAIKSKVAVCVAAGADEGKAYKFVIEGVPAK